MDAAKKLFFAQQILAALFLVTNKLQMQGDKQLGDITLRQMLAIPAIFHAPEGKATINHIARHLGTSKQSAKHVINAMVRKNYLSVAPSVQDKRAVHITVTPQGEKAFGVCSERTDMFLAEIFRQFTTEELEQMHTLLEKLYQFDQNGQGETGGHHNFPGNNGFDEAHTNEILQHHQHFFKAVNNTLDHSHEKEK